MFFGFSPLLPTLAASWFWLFFKLSHQLISEFRNNWAKRYFG